MIPILELNWRPINKEFSETTRRLPHFSHLYTQNTVHAKAVGYMKSNGKFWVMGEGSPFPRKAVFTNKQYKKEIIWGCPVWLLHVRSKQRGLWRCLLFKRPYMVCWDRRQEEEECRLTAWHRWVGDTLLPICPSLAALPHGQKGS